MPAQTSMTDREFTEDVLLTAKTLTGLYHNATQEASTEQVYNQFKTNLNDSICMQHDIYSQMEQRGWYPKQQAQQQQVDQVKTKYAQTPSSN